MGSVSLFSSYSDFFRTASDEKLGYVMKNWDRQDLF